MAETVVLDVAMPLRQWKHGARLVCKMWWAIRSGCTLGEAVRIDWDAMNAFRGAKCENDSACTYLANGWLTGSLLERTFGDMSSDCPFVRGVGHPATPNGLV